MLLEGKKIKQSKNRSSVKAGNSIAGRPWGHAVTL